MSGVVALLGLAWRTSRVRMSAAVLLNLVAGAAWPGTAAALGKAVSAIQYHDARQAALLGVLAGLGVIGTLVLQHFSYVAYVELGELAMIDLDCDLMTVVNSAGRLSDLESPDGADAVDMLRRDIHTLPEGLTGFFTLTSMSVSLVLTAVLLARVDVLLLLLPLAALPALLAERVRQRFSENAKLAAAQPTRRARSLFRLAAEPASSKELRLCGLRDRVIEQHRASWQMAARTLIIGEAKAAAVAAAGQLVFSLAYVAAVLWAIQSAIETHEPIGDVLLVIVLGAQTNQLVSTGARSLQQLRRVSAGVGRLRELREKVVDRPETEEPYPLPARMRHGLELRDVSFHYSGATRDALAAVTLTIPQGTTVALVGDNGAGKTTLTKLLCRFYEPSSGSIFLDGRDLGSYGARQWHARVSATFQDFVRWELSAQHAVGIGDAPRIDDGNAVTEALAIGGGAEVLDKLPRGLATQLGRSWREGEELSGGQWQRFAVGRALMRQDPLLVILDEPASALDPAAEYRLFARYAEIARRYGERFGTITVIVSHRFSTVRSADLIVVVENGAVVEAGSHDDLMRRGGAYAELYSMQAAAYQ
jgi:ATP-binding cassette subfamily B protein